MAESTPIAPADGQHDMYDVLGVPHDADPFDIRRVYREKVRALRLDVPPEPEAHERLRELTHAYEVLSNPRSRLLYDRVRGTGSGSLQHGADKGTREWLELDDEELSVWVLGRDRGEKPQPIRAMSLPSRDLVTRAFAASGFVIALFLLVVVLLRG
jgi:curved DNA-binding protein CbpA